MSTSPRTVRSVAPMIRPLIASASSWVRRPRSIILAWDLAMAERTPSTLSWPRATKVTAYPALAKTSTIPVAIVPEPMTPTDSMVRTSTPARVPSAGVCASATTSGEPAAAYV